MKSSIAWLKQWARTAVQAVTDVKSYRHVGKRRLGEAFGHLAMLAVLWTLPITAMFFMGLRDFTRAVAAGLRDDIPPGTVFEMKDGRLTNNLAEPLVFRERGATVIVNTASSTLVLAEGETGLMVDAEGMVSQEGARTETMSFKEAPDFTIDREGLMEKIARWAPLALFVGSLFVLVFMFLLFWAGMLLNALIHGFVLWLLYKIIKRPHAWRETFVVAAYAGTAAIVLRILIQGFVPASPAPDIVYWAYIAWIAYDAYKGGAQAPKKEEPAAEGPRPEGKS